ncbi:site-specific recombinases [Pelotomaculum thermopropionicum SI]|uniref:Site-specific recombinases n=1 Tax=Pelotomaculum thermopropionicum (strain DSM 13744 / JCM 10971 / SI) TaxID=370438 RepID=A5D5W2_PELTS|nr:site-specific recombinases [Pelotomaculum thermopropionicum SI]
MDEEYMPAHIQGRKLDVLDDPSKTIDQKGIDVGGYIRISTKKDSQKTSIENQEKLLKQWADVNGYNLYRCYTDVKTGKYMYLRNEVQQMLEDLKEGKIRGVVSKEIARTSRDIMDVLDLKRKIVSLGGFFKAIKENYDSRTDDDEFLLVLYGALAQKEQKTTASRVKVTQLIKAKEGKTNVPLPAFGYMLSEDRQRLVRNPETYPHYRFMVERFINGWGQLKIAKYLNKNGILSRRGCKWSTSAIKTILTNPVYLGVTIYNTTTLIRDHEGKQKRVMRPRDEWIIRYNTHEPLITEEEFKKIQAILQERSEKDCKEWTCERKYLGSTLLRCAVCGGKIYGSRFMSKKKGAGYFYRYICRGVNGNCNSPAKYWDMEKVDWNIRELFRTLFGDKEKLFDYIQKEPGILNEDTSEFLKERDALINKVVHIDRAMKKQQSAFENDAITMDEYKTRLAELRAEKNEALARIGKLDAKLLRHDSVMDRLKKVLNRVSDKIERIHELPTEEVAEYLDAVFESLYLGEDGTIVDVEFKD